MLDCLFDFACKLTRSILVDFMLFNSEINIYCYAICKDSVFFCFSLWNGTCKILFLMWILFYNTKNNMLKIKLPFYLSKKKHFTPSHKNCKRKQSRNVNATSTETSRRCQSHDEQTGRQDAPCGTPPLALTAEWQSTGSYTWGTWLNVKLFSLAFFLSVQDAGLLIGVSGVNTNIA